MRAADARRSASIISNSSISASLTLPTADELQSDCTTNTSAPRTFSLISIRHSSLRKRSTSAEPTRVSIFFAISSARPRFEFPLNTSGFCVTGFLRLLAPATFPGGSRCPRRRANSRKVVSDQPREGIGIGLREQLFRKTMPRLENDLVRRTGGALGIGQVALGRCNPSSVGGVARISVVDDAERNPFPCEHPAHGDEIRRKRGRVPRLVDVEECGRESD